jgi:hypothetical protein
MGNTNNPYADQYGFRVIELKASSPAEQAGLTVSSDFIISINGKYLNDLETSEITRLVAVSDISLVFCLLFLTLSFCCTVSPTTIHQENESKSVHLWVWNSGTDQNREVFLTPSRNWPGEGLLGVIIRYDRYDADKKSSVSVYLFVSFLADFFSFFLQEQNMAFDQLYEGGENADQHFGRNEKIGPKPITGPNQPQRMERNKSGFLGISGKKGTPTGKISVFL